MMAVWGMHLDFSPDSAGGALFPYLECMADQAFGMALGRGGADVIVSGLTRAITAAGGEIRLGAPVQSIVTENGAAKGVVLAGGERIEATRAVIANLHPRVLFGGLVPESSAAMQRLAKFRLGPATMMIHFALSDLPAWSAGADLRQFAYVHLAPSMAAMARTYTEALDGLLPAEPALVVGQPTAIDPSRAPAGQHILWVQVRVCRRKFAATPPAASPARNGTRQRKLRRPGRRIIERYAPGFAATILGRTVPPPPISSATILIWSAATASAAVIISIRIFSLSRLRLVALPHTGRPIVHGRGLDLAGRRRRRRFRLHAGENACGGVSILHSSPRKRHPESRDNSITYLDFRLRGNERSIC